MDIDVVNIIKSCAGAIRLSVWEWSKETPEKQEYLRRQEICSKCPVFTGNTCGDGATYSIEGKTYNTCGCVIVCKAALMDNNCPNGLWGVYNENKGE
jgi:hypothetical protein